MEDESDGDDDIPTISVGGEEFDITDVTPEIIAKMTSEEMEKYNQLYQDFYKDMYDWSLWYLLVINLNCRISQ